MSSVPINLELDLCILRISGNTEKLGAKTQVDCVSQFCIDLFTKATYPEEHCHVTLDHKNKLYFILPETHPSNLFSPAECHRKKKIRQLYIRMESELITFPSCSVQEQNICCNLSVISGSIEKQLICLRSPLHF